MVEHVKPAPGSAPPKSVSTPVVDVPPVVEHVKLAPFQRVMENTTAVQHTPQECAQTSTLEPCVEAPAPQTQGSTGQVTQLMRHTVEAEKHVPQERVPHHTMEQVIAAASPELQNQFRRWGEAGPGADLRSTCSRRQVCRSTSSYLRRIGSRGRVRRNSTSGNLRGTCSR